MRTRKSSLKNIVSSCVVCSEHCIASLGPPLFFKGEGVNSKYLPPEEGKGESEKLKKEGESMVHWQVFLKGEGWHFSY